MAENLTRNLLNHPLISERYFFPRPGTCPTPFWVDCGDALLACYYRQVDPKAFTLVHFHGNGEIIDDYLDSFIDLVADMGCNCLLAEFRGYGRSTGKPELGKMLDDVAKVVTALGQPPEQLVFFGRSVGSIFALEAAALFPDAAGLVLESGVADVLERLLLRIAPRELEVTAEQFKKSVTANFNHQEKLGQFAGPVLVLHARWDSLVDVSHGECLYQWSVGKKRLVVFPRGDHNDVMFVNAREYFAALGEFLARLEPLRPPRNPTGA